MLFISNINNLYLREYFISTIDELKANWLLIPKISSQRSSPIKESLQWLQLMLLEYKKLTKILFTRKRIKRTKVKETKQKTKKTVKKRRRKTTRKIIVKTNLHHVIQISWRVNQQSYLRTMACAEQTKKFNCLKLKHPGLEEWIKAKVSTPIILDMMKGTNSKTQVKERIQKKKFWNFKGAEVVFTQKLSNQLFFQKK